MALFYVVCMAIAHPRVSWCRRLYTLSYYITITFTTLVYIDRLRLAPFQTFSINVLHRSSESEEAALYAQHNTASIGWE